MSSPFQYPQITKYVTPRKHQIKHYEYLDKILTNGFYYLDGSKPGAGKTFPPLYFSQKYKIPLLVICPVTVAVRWQEVSKEYNVPILDIISYNSIRSTRGHQPKHGFLTRNEQFDVNTQRITVDFIPTDKLKNLIQSGVIIVFDECHALKNRSIQWKACKAITHEIMSCTNRSKICLLSGTFYDKIEHSVQLLELTEIIKSHFMYRFVQGEMNWEDHGLGEVIDFAKQCDEKKTIEILNKYQKEKRWKNCDQKSAEMICITLCHRLLSGIIKDHIGSIIPDVVVRNLKNTPLCELLQNVLHKELANMCCDYYYQHDKKNGYYTVSQQTAFNITRSLQGLARALGYNRDNNTIDFTKLGMGTSYLMQIEKEKIDDIFVRVTKEELRKNPKKKIVIFLNYLSNVDEVYEKLKYLGVVKLTGASKNRAKIIDTFNNDSNCHVLVGIMSVGGVGVELDDKIGDAERFMLLSPSFSAILSHQAAQRIIRENTKSNAKCRFAYANIHYKQNQIKEVKILTAMGKKTDVMKAINSSSVDLLPGDYEDEYENPETEIIAINEKKKEDSKQKEMVNDSYKKYVSKLRKNNENEDLEKYLLKLQMEEYKDELEEYDRELEKMNVVIKSNKK
jgi:hypothetical protein